MLIVDYAKSPGLTVVVGAGDEAGVLLLSLFENHAIA